MDYTDSAIPDRIGAVDGGLVMHPLSDTKGQVAIMRLHVHEAGVPAAVTHPDVPGDRRLEEIVVVEKEEIVFRVGDREEIDVRLTVVEIFGEGHGHVIKHHCREINATIDYAGNETTMTLHPADLVKDVRTEAIKKLAIDPATAADLVLRLRGTSDDLLATTPIGAYVSRESCAVVLDLVHVVRPQG